MLTADYRKYEKGNMTWTETDIPAEVRADAVIT